MEGKPETVVAPITKAESIDAGLAVGEQVPVEASLLTTEGETNLGQILQKGPVLVVFTRSVEWCPYCQTQLKSINAIVGDLKDRGYKLYGLSYDSPDQQDRFSKNQMLQYDMLSDQSSTVIDAFGLRDPHYTKGRAVGVPYASVFLIDRSGKIIAKSVSGDYKKRPTNEQILALVDSI
ncbi:MAG: peroxiredoxin family protein [Sphingomonadales bacterium]|nr:peroxiredoxin family protein [Sphingomonadales bacterium]NCP27964.1 peroxiredoxin family protein [Sphingomonadales bacterium]NCP48492.1 peroxiredoxin family protein [Sphingomonadales bacterium]NCQ47797.1 peroxiredoxin family protein [Sphingomonadales bacterium]